MRAHARGLYCGQAAVELLIGHRRWLDREDFVARFIQVGGGPVVEWAWVDWPAAVAALTSGALTCSASEGQVLLIAASIAAGVPVDLRAAVTGLDEDNIALVAEAVLQANGCSGRAASAGVATW
ncbi:MAG: hypothetical protein ACM3ML_12620 [Micromonosporaceae bacterium]